jgi:hypothetical protein
VFNNKGYEHGQLPADLANVHINFKPSIIEATLRSHLLTATNWCWKASQFTEHALSAPIEEILKSPTICESVFQVPYASQE